LHWLMAIMVLAMLSIGVSVQILFRNG
jgi:cytochrome b561